MNIQDTKTVDDFVNAVNNLPKKYKENVDEVLLNLALAIVKNDNSKDGELYRVLYEELAFLDDDQSIEQELKKALSSYDNHYQYALINYDESNANLVSYDNIQTYIDAIMNGF
ncbi:hypothetical protein [uncultured Lactobacillus sp.]|uniref:hypothetical protein n=1 Tax=uncultured Lactobacillus sp. TaxID=153152 RepID=UPI0025D99BCD|nr:hypothetical protein [uncultured Lactobacillus sp.]